MANPFSSHIVVYASHGLEAFTEKNLSDKCRWKSHWPKKTAKRDVVKSDQQGERKSRIQEMKGGRGGGKDRIA